MRDDANSARQSPLFMRDTSWSRVGLPLAAGLLVLAPLVRRRVGRATLLVYLQLPAYMLHQYEEHGHGAFKREMNALLPPTVGRLTDRNIFLTNVVGVWGSDVAATALAATSRRLPGWSPRTSPWSTPCCTSHRPCGRAATIRVWRRRCCCSCRSGRTASARSARRCGPHDARMA